MQDPIDAEIEQLQTLLGVRPRTRIESAPRATWDRARLGKNDVEYLLYRGDNLDVLRHLRARNQAFDLCYIDPPYNTGSDFCYRDSRHGDQALSVFGAHGEWMNFLLPRLVYAKHALVRTGVLAVSIDDYEIASLKILLDLVFGPPNHLGTIVVRRSKNGKGSHHGIATNHEYLLVYGRTAEALLTGREDDPSAYDRRDEGGAYRIDGLFRKKGHASRREDRPNLYYPLYARSDGSVSVDPRPQATAILPRDALGRERRWLWSRETARERETELHASPGGTIYVKHYYDPNKRVKLRSWWDNPDFLTDRATNELKDIFGHKVFDTPKPLGFVRHVVETMSRPGARVLDFFAGSGTTAHATFLANQGATSPRSCVLVEEDAALPEDHDGRVSGYRSIADITEARLAHLRSLDPELEWSPTPTSPEESRV